jgi:hypothetical protein
LERQCEPYRSDQLLFKYEPELFRRVSASGREDLVDLDALEPIAGYAGFKTENGYARLSRLLSPQIVSWAKEHYPKAKLFIRIDPNRFYQQQPKVLLNEMTIRPADPRWLAHLSLRSGMTDGAQYDLEPGELPTDQKRYWEYHVQNIRRLEFASRRKGSYLSMMLEEVPDLQINRDLVSARCVHLDTEDPVGTPFGKVTMKHLIRNKDAPEIRASPAQAKRIASAVDAIKRRLDSAKIQTSASDESSSLRFSKGDDYLILRIEEAVEEVEVAPTQEQKRRPSWTWQNKLKQPSGKLSFRIWRRYQPSALTP